MSREPYGLFSTLLRDVPFDIAREIIEMAAFTHRETLLNLSLVSTLIHSWIDPGLYQVLRLSTWKKIRLFARTVTGKNPTDRAIIQDNIAIVELGSELTLRDLLDSCISLTESVYITLEAVKKAQSFWFSNTMELFFRMPNDSRIIAQLYDMAPLRVYYSSASFIFEQMRRSSRCLRNITHLHIPHDFIRSDFKNARETISTLPNLQYILLSVTTGYPSIVFPACLKVAQFLVGINELPLRLCGLLVGAARQQALEDLVEESGNERDPRIVVLVAQDEPHVDWEGSYYGRPDLFEEGKRLTVLGGSCCDITLA
ncbi:hypothetical protein DL96DRAFT_1713061 [Flagelloscypha sp. PMI_526]|nr:hypothetical protein DL96DRAFT_1713061 [Flagelloscypha sp. PMI_526]